MLHRQLTCDSEKVAEQNSEECPCFLRGPSIQPKGVEPDTLESETMNIFLETWNQRLHIKSASSSSGLQNNCISH